MKILGRASDKEYDSMTHRQDLIVQMSVDEWNAWRGLTGPSSTNDFPLTPETVESFLSLRYAMQEAAKTMGMKLVALRDAAGSMSGGTAVMVAADAAGWEPCGVENVPGGKCGLKRGHEGRCQ